MYRVKITEKAKRELKEISKLEEQTLLSVLYELRENPFYGKPLQDKLAKRFSMRVGVFRIIYAVNRRDKTVHIISAGHRSTIYS